ncbi:hypothetical protein A9Q83_03880 [Alphaproteobacteria bacterium 46_93_T64]|nr:hypothetical protein A9Q83_03880 [Alphaproteobacteria bacterium 46_93_T64]
MEDLYVTQAIEHISGILGYASEEISAEDTIETIDKWDSLNHMRLILHIEEKLGSMIDTEDTLLLFSVSGIAAYLRKSDNNT